MTSPHKDHRKRLKNRYINEGLDGFELHQVVELLLFYAIPQGDTNPLAHVLANRFGSLAGIMDATLEELMEVDGVGEHTATLIRLIPAMSRAYQISKEESGVNLDSAESAGRYLLPYFSGLSDEVVYIICMDSKMKLTHCSMVFHGSVNSTHVNFRKIVEIALRKGATNLIIAHNHPGGIALPSPEDIATTIRLRDTLQAVSIRLVDHIIVADNDFVSLRDSGRL